LQWVKQVITSEVMEIIFPREGGGSGRVETHCFLFCCGAVVNIASSLAKVKLLADE
jgi:hypothetical protein